MFPLTRWLWERGGHIGYGIRPAFRGRGYARAALCQALVVARAEGVDQVLLMCDEKNEASAAVVLAAGGREGDGFRAEHGARRCLEARRERILGGQRSRPSPSRRKG